MTFICELDPYFLEIYGMCENELPTSRLSKVIVLPAFLRMHAFSYTWSLPVTRQRSHRWIRHTRKPLYTQTSWRYLLQNRSKFTLREQECFFYIFCSCDLDLDPMIFMYELDLYSLEMYRMCGNKLLTSRLSDRRTYRQKTRMKLYTTWLCGWSKYCFSEVSGGIFRSPDVCTSEDLNKRC